MYAESFTSFYKPLFETQSWCFDVISPTHKDEPVNDPKNYRGICISSALLKIVCSLLSNRIKDKCQKHKLINENQIGFKSKHHTSDHLLTLKSVVKNTSLWEKGNYLLAL